jgi:biotin operon repressor
MKTSRCYECDRVLSKDEMALSRKMLGRDINHFFCLGCLADYLECSPEDLEIKIQEFREQGCSLFL